MQMRPAGAFSRHVMRSIQHGRYTVTMTFRTVFTVMLIALVVLPTGCTTAPKIKDPRTELQDVNALPQNHLAAMRMLDAEPNDRAYLEQLHGLIWRPGYTPQVRMAALERLEERDLPGLKVTIRQRFPNLVAWEWLKQLAGVIADRGWIDLTPALVSSWARPTVFTQDETERPEYQALARLHGDERVGDMVFDLFVESRSVAQHGLRTRCWALLHRLGQRERLLDLVANAEIHPEDAMMMDLRAGVVDLGILPRNREEILWLRQLRMPARETFWAQATEAVQGMDARRRASLELRDLPVVVSAAMHEPDLLRASEAELYARLDSQLRGRKHHDARSNYNNMRNTAERLYAHRESLTWGDLAAMLLALRAFQTPEMVSHLFDYAERDRLDKTTEYGGILSLDDSGRFILQEFPPRQRRNDNTFMAPQEMFDAGYTGLFHFHYHAQKHRNVEYASPGFGDFRNANETLTNNLVFTFIDQNTLNMDFYRHGGVVVDLGEIKK